MPVLLKLQNCFSQSPNSASTERHLYDGIGPSVQIALQAKNILQPFPSGSSKMTCSDGPRDLATPVGLSVGHQTQENVSTPLQPMEEPNGVRRALVVSHSTDLTA